MPEPVHASTIDGGRRLRSRSTSPLAVVNVEGSVLAHDEHADVTVQQYRLKVVSNARLIRSDSPAAEKVLDHGSSAFVDLANKVILDYASYAWQTELDATAKETRAADA